MQIQDLFIKCSDWRPFKSRTLNKIVGNSSKIIARVVANMVLPIYFKLFPGIKIYRNRCSLGRQSQTIVTMTSFPARISYVWLVIECLLRQTVVPSRIIVYLSKEQFQNKTVLPENLRNYPDDIVEFRFVNGDIRSHKKYWYAVEEWKDRPIVIVDDDIVYDSRMIEDLESASRQMEKTIACCWGITILWSDNGELNPYSLWRGKRTKKTLGKRDHARFFGSGGGTYFPVGSLKDANLELSTLMSICPTADDIWLNAIARKNGYRAALIRNYVSVLEWKIKNNQKLCTINNDLHENDKQLYAVRQFILNSFHIDPFDNNS